MENENLINENVNETQENDSQKYIDVINSMKATSVSKEQYAKLQEENTQLIEALKSGNQIEMVTDEDKPSLKDLASTVSDENFEVNNMEGWKTVLDYRKTAIENGLRDPFLPNSRDYTVKPEDSARAQQIADTLEKILDESNENPDMFNAIAKQYIQVK